MFDCVFAVRQIVFCFACLVGLIALFVQAECCSCRRRNGISIGSPAQSDLNVQQLGHSLTPTHAHTLAHAHTHTHTRADMSDDGYHALAGADTDREADTEAQTAQTARTTPSPKTEAERETHSGADRQMVTVVASPSNGESSPSSAFVLSLSSLSLSPRMKSAVRTVKVVLLASLHAISGLFWFLWVSFLFRRSLLFRMAASLAVAVCAIFANNMPFPMFEWCASLFFGCLLRSSAMLCCVNRCYWLELSALVCGFVASYMIAIHRQP